MLKRVAALIMVLLFAGQSLAGGIVCGIDAISKGLNQSSEAACPMEKSDACDMACCMQGKSPTGSIVAMVCCEVKCGESTSGAQFNFAPLNLAPAPSVIFVRLVSLDALSEAEASLSAVSLRSAENNFLHYDPPDLFLQNSAFLI
ncbi:MAG TPA: hypothetical protein VE715_21195 [Blastocatellia bacterium]|nr:hypothetical protein [Blastocatellia bacterium]